MLEGPVALVVAAAAASALPLVWWALTKWPLEVISASALDTSSQAGPAVFLGLVLTGWLDGIVGLAGASPIRPGLLTISGTVVLAVVTYYTYSEQRRSGQVSDAVA
jgi:hypothetical protein